MWHERLRPFLPKVGLTLLVGGYAQKHYLGKEARKTLTETVAAWRAYGPDIWPLPHPSWRSTVLVRKNPWFEADLLPELRTRVAALLGER